MSLAEKAIKVIRAGQRILCIGFVNLSSGIVQNLKEIYHEKGRGPVIRKALHWNVKQLKKLEKDLA